jgi:hypothetical protein
MEEFLYRAQPWAITLWQHNWPVIVFGLSSVIAAVLALVRPSRPRLLALYGLLGLVLAFEYDKHGVPAFQHTATYLLSVERNATARTVSLVIIGDVAPIALYIVAIGLVLLATLLAWPGRAGAGAKARAPRDHLSARRARLP